MTNRFFDTVFSESVRAAQAGNGSADAYGRHLGKSTGPDIFTMQEASFIRARDSFYMASTNQSGWPYVQHRGGPAGFVKVLDESSFGIADFRGNRQYVSLGNTAADDRVALFFMDYPNRRRLKVLAHLKSVDLAERPDLADRLIDENYGAKIERGFVFSLEAFDWNCPQHITPRFTNSEISEIVEQQEEKIRTLEKELAGLRAQKRD